MKIFILPLFLTLVFGCSFLQEDPDEEGNNVTHDFTQCASACDGFFEPGEHTYKYAYESYERVPGGERRMGYKVRVMRVPRFERKEGVEFDVDVRDSGETPGLAFDSTYRLKYKIISGLYYSDHTGEVGIGIQKKCDSGGYCDRSYFFDSLYFDPGKMRKTVYRGDTLYFLKESGITHVQRMGLIEFLGLAGSSASFPVNLIEKDGVPFNLNELGMID